MLDIPSIQIRSNLVRFMLEKYDSTTNRFKLQPNVDGISLEGVDVECILGLPDEGLIASSILYEEGEEAANNVPPHLVSSSSGNFVIDDMIADVLKTQIADNDFIRKSVLVLLGTILAPENVKIVPLKYYAIVQYVGRIKKINFNELTRSCLLDSLKQIQSGYEMRQWPKGNVALLQVPFELQKFNVIECQNDLI